MTEERFDRDSLYFWAANCGPFAVGPIGKLINVAGSLEGAYVLSAEDKRKALGEKTFEAFSEGLAASKEQIYEMFLKTDMHFVSIEDERYPGRLREIKDAPWGLFYLGELREERPSCAIIGARDCSEYGRYVASETAATLAKAGVDIISGMARGIDGVSQKAALDAGGYSIGVLGSGADICYPPGNRELYNGLIRQGCVLSAFPPGTPAKQMNFPMRNRYVSALADVLLVVEARLKSGTLITVDCALEQGREVYAVPGRVTDRISDGCNRLIDLGAGVFTSPDQFKDVVLGNFRHHEKSKVISRSALSDLSENHLSSIKSKNKDKISKLDPLLQKIYSKIDEYPKSLGRIVTEMGEEYNPLEVNIKLQELILEDYIKEVSYGFYCLKD